MSFNLNYSKQPEYNLQENLINESINMYGIQCKYLHSERINTDELVFQDFSHFKVGTEYTDITILPEDSSNWQDEQNFGGFGLYNNQNQVVYLSKSSLEKINDDSNSDSASIINSLLITPASQILEITDMTQYEPGVNNLWSYSDEPSVYKLTLRAYSANLSDEGVSKIKTEIDLSEGPEGSRDDGKIFDAEAEIDTSDIDEFFDSLATKKDTQDTEGDKISNTGGVFGNLS